MKAFKFYCGEMFYVFAAESKSLAIQEFEYQTGDVYTLCEEIPESEWDQKIITTFEDNDISGEPILMSIRDVIIGNEPQLICTNDPSEIG